MNRWMLALLVAGLTGASILLDAQQTAAPDIILTNGKIITVDDRFSIAQAVAVRGDRIVAEPARTSRGWRARTRGASTCGAGPSFRE